LTSLGTCAKKKDKNHPHTNKVEIRGKKKGKGENG